MKPRTASYIRQGATPLLRNAALLVITLVSLVPVLTGCANPGSGPDGGPYDETPPRIVSMSPALGQRNAHDRKITITFDELIKIENAAEKIIVSPPQTEVPEIRTSGRRITVSLLDSLRPNTTYTVDFSDAIADANEGNPLGNFTYYFSTGERLDTLEVAGHVLEAGNLEPVKGILVGLHADTTETAFTTKPFDRVARTDAEGRFSVKGVAPGTYRVYALRDMDGDFLRSKGEMMAALRGTVTPSGFPAVRYDTVWHDSIRYDSIRTVHYTHYVPDDLVLLAYTEKPTERYFLKSQRDVPEWFRIYFTAPSAHVPVVRGLNFDAGKNLLEQRSAGNDTITYWLRDMSLPVIDTLKMAYTYEAYDDSTQTNILRTDTLELVPRQTMARRLKQQAEEHEKWLKKLEKRHKKGDYSNETPPTVHLKFACKASRTLAPDHNLNFESEEPMVSLDTAGLHLHLVVDSIRTEAGFRLLPSADSLMGFTVMGEWRYGQQYEMTVDSAAVTGLSGRTNDKYTFKFGIGQEDDYGSVFILLSGADPSAVVQLLSSDTKVERQVRSRNGQADFFYVRPGKYYLRLFYDHNGNGYWDTGDYARGVAPEEVFYFPMPVEVRANWDIEQTWRPDELPLTRQKPQELQRQKKEKEKTVRNRNAERERNKGR